MSQVLAILGKVACLNSFLILSSFAKVSPQSRIVQRAEFIILKLFFYLIYWIDLCAFHILSEDTVLAALAFRLFKAFIFQSLAQTWSLKNIHTHF